MCAPVTTPFKYMSQIKKDRNSSSIDLNNKKYQMYKCCNALSARDEFLPVKEEAIRSILDYDINIYPLNPEDTSYTALNMNYSVAGFQLVLTRKASFYVVTYYLPSGLFVVVSWISFLINPEVGKSESYIPAMKVH